MEMYVNGKSNNWFEYRRGRQKRMDPYGGVRQRWLIPWERRTKKKKKIKNEIINVNFKL